MSSSHVKLNVANESRTRMAILKCPMSLSAMEAEIKAAPQDAMAAQNPIHPTVSCNRKFSKDD